MHLKKIVNFYIKTCNSYIDLQVERVQKEADETERSLRERISKQDLMRTEIEEEISRLKSSLSAERERAADQLRTTKLRLKSEEVISPHLMAFCLAAECHVS